MTKSKRELRVILIGGSSHVGKSTLAQSLQSRLGWGLLATDSLARHPGCPWKTKPAPVPEHVAEPYLSLSVEELYADVLRHYKSLWPEIERVVTLHATDFSYDRLIVEGSVLWPETVATLDLDGVAAVWLTASHELFQSRIRNASRMEAAAAREKTMAEKFLARTLHFNDRLMEAVNRHGLSSMDVEAASSLDELTSMCLEIINH